MPLSKRQLGIGYLAAIGVVFAGFLFLGIARAVTQPDFTRIGVLVIGLVPAVSLASGHYWLSRFRFTDDQIWRIAIWCGLGIGGLTVIVIGIFILNWFLEPVADGGLLLVSSNVTFGGVAGVLVGALWESNKTARRYRERNTVLNRVLRHNLRNDINVIHGRVSLIERHLDHECDHTDVIKQKVRDILRMSEQSRAIEQVIASNQADPYPVDLAPMLSERIDSIEEQFPGANVTVDIPDTAWVYADDMVDTAIGNLIENAIEHNSGPPQVGVEVTIDELANEVRIVIEDDGPGIPEIELEVLSEGTETALEHGSGMGLWLVKWFVHSYDGELEFHSDDSGSTVEVTLPGAQPLDGSETNGRKPLRRMLA